MGTNESYHVAPGNEELPMPEQPALVGRRAPFGDWHPEQPPRVGREQDHALTALMTTKFRTSACESEPALALPTVIANEPLATAPTVTK